MAGEVRWQFLSVAEQQQIHIFFFLWPPEQIHILPRKPHATSTPQTPLNCPSSPSPLAAGFWLWAGCGVAEDSAGQRGRVERVTAWRGLNIWDGTDMLMYTTHLILFAKNIPCLQLSFRAGQIEYSHVISYFWLFARQRTHQAFVFYDNCQSVIRLIWRLRALECFSSNLESDLSSVTRHHRARETNVKQQKKRLKRRVSDETGNDETRFLGKMG